MIENRNEIEIQAIPQEVWQVLTDMARHSEWNPLIYQAEGNIEVGQTVRMSARTASIDMKFNCRVVRVDLNQEFEWWWHIVLPFLFRGEHIFTIEPVDAQTVRFIDREIFKGLLVPFWTKDLMTNSKDAMVAMDKALKERVEGLRV